MSLTKYSGIPRVRFPVQLPAKRLDTLHIAGNDGHNKPAFRPATKAPYNIWSITRTKIHFIQRFSFWCLGNGFWKYKPNMTQKIYEIKPKAEIKCAASRKWLTSGLSTNPLLTIHHPRKAWKHPRKKIKIIFGISFLEIFFLSQKNKKGIMNTKPINLPNTLWKYSQKKINLNSERVMPLFTFWYSGNCLYSLKTSCQSTSFNGGIAPLINCQSVIDKPDSVRRVTPPIMTIIAVKIQPINNQYIIALWGLSLITLISFY